ncbi:MAG: NAD(P)H-dependent oxidoreductase [Candidatus Magasanikbacteria bacterium]|nr:NAD(P)H-dependent oxidoreductase [Candidatus Magasanikbacteria bacterium]
MELSNIIEQLNWRAAVKLFDPEKKISETEVEQLLEVLRLSPSSFGLQPWKFIVVKDVETRKKLQAASYNQTQVIDASHFIVLCSKTSLNQEDVDHYIETVASVRGIIKEDLSGMEKSLSGFISHKSPDEFAVWSTKQVYIALGNLLSACAMAGIDACPMEGFEVSKYNEILELTSLGLTANVVCAIGYRSESDRGGSNKKVRFPKEEVVIVK